MKQDIWNNLKLVNVNVDEMQVFVIINKTGIKISVDLNVENWLIEEDVIKDLCRILVIVNVNVTNYVTQENI